MSTAADLTDVCVVVPMYNEATVLAGVLANLMDTFPFVLCVDDGSSDGSAEIARAAGATVLRHAVNLGQGAALQTGFDFALNSERFSHVVTFDADGQHDPSDARAMVMAAQETGVDVVLGTRAMEGTVGSTPQPADDPQGSAPVLPLVERARADRHPQRTPGAQSRRSGERTTHPAWHGLCQ